MANKSVVEALDKLLQDLCENKAPFGGKLIVFGGDFGQVLPVVRGGGRREQVQASLGVLIYGHTSQKIPLEPNPSENKYLIPFVRRQVPLRLCFAMSINKTQGQTLDYVGLYLKQPVFTHGQLYVAISRAKTGKNVKVLVLPPIARDIGTKYTTNVVYDEVLLRASFL
ncbi:hypothetical protein LIER_35858 [Lithospermum erythrorhizon]|uniref:ATP-dependent DNA helicase n=1 Tax=Lithospermum erythrorhizon TaxID=34254 RepID=A0AAV3NYV5_LITER